jgi:hypothetical protein
MQTFLDRLSRGLGIIFREAELLLFASFSRKRRILIDEFLTL